MNTNVVSTPAPSPVETGPPTERKLALIGPAVVLVVLFWATQVVTPLLDLPIYAGFFTIAGAGALFVLAFSIWWWLNRELSWKGRLAGFATLAALAALVVIVGHKSV